MMMYPQNQYNNPMMMNNYNYNYPPPNNKVMGDANKMQNQYNNPKKKNNFNENNNPMVRNAKIILDNNINNIKKKQKTQSAKRVNDINKSNEMGYQGGQGLYNMNNYNKGMNNMMYNNNPQMMNSPPPQVFNNNNNSQFNNQYNNMNNMNMINNSRPQNLNKGVKKAKVSDYQFMEFHPYTLKDYKELTRNPVVMGPLGANIGTQEWEVKRNKMKKMQNYSNNINKEHKGITSLKKDSPKEEAEKLTKEKIEKSIRHRQYEYSKLVRAGKYKDENENLGKISSDNLGPIPENEDDLYLRKYEDQLRQETDNINNPKPIKPITPVVPEEKIVEEKENHLDLEQLLKQKETYKAKIQGIRDTLLD